MKRTATLRTLVLTAVLIALLVGTAQSGQIVGSTYQFNASQGYNGGKTVYYLMTDVSDPGYAATFGVNYTPLLANAYSNAYLPTAYYVTNKPQGLIFSADWPGSNYAPIWALRLVTWRSGSSVVLKSAADVLTNHNVSVSSPGIVIGASIVINSSGTKIPQARVYASGVNRFVILPLGGVYANGNTYYNLRLDFSQSFEANAYRGTYAPALSRFNALRIQNRPPCWQKLYSIFTVPKVGQLPVAVAAPGDMGYSPLMNEWTVYSKTTNVIYKDAASLTAAYKTAVTNYMSFQPIVGSP